MDIAELRAALETCRELREYDRKEIERLQSCLYAQEAVEPLYDEIKRLRAAIRWTREVHPGKNPESGGAIVHMTWEEFRAMRALAAGKVIPGTNIPDAGTPSY